MNVTNPRFPSTARLKLVSILLLLTSLLGCQTLGSSKPGDSDTFGAILGGAAGAFIGSKAGSGSGRVLTTGAGALVGAFVGREIARYLSHAGQQQMAEANTRALETGQSQIWRDPETGVTGRTDVSGRTTEHEQVPVRVQKDRIDQMPPIDLIGTTYVTKSGSNVRGGPGTDYRSVGSLSAGQAVHVIGKVQDKNWYLISEGGAANGFVATRLLRPAEVEQPPVAPSSSAQGEVMMVSADRTCSINTTKVTQPDGSVAEDRIRICEGPDGYVIEDV